MAGGGESIRRCLRDTSGHRVLVAACRGRLRQPDRGRLIRLQFYRRVLGVLAKYGLEEFVAAVEGALRKRRPVMVHCMGGRGRTGTLIACYLVSRGMKPWASIAEVRKRRRGSIETREQEEAVVSYARYLSERR